MCVRVSYFRIYENNGMTSRARNYAKFVNSNYDYRAFRTFRRESEFSRLIIAMAPIGAVSPTGKLYTWLLVTLTRLSQRMQQEINAV